jgi:M6 family metalloprotease-like protein
MTPSFTLRLLQRALLVLTSAACGGVADEPVAREVGSTAQAIVPVNGLRRLLVVLVDAAPGRPVAHTAAEYRQRLFGPGYPNLSDYFGAISNRSMTVVEAGLVHGTAHPSDDTAFWKRAQVPADEKDAAQIGRYATLQIAEDAGFDFSQWDFDGDGVVRRDELAILQIDSVNDGGGQTGTIGCTKHSGVQVCATVSLTAHRGELMLYAHELLHQINYSVDVYGVSQGLNVGLTTMSATGSIDRDYLYYLDPVHRSLAGWETRLMPILGSSSGSLQLASVADPSTGGNRGLVLSHRGSTQSEYLYFEYRRPLANSYDRDVPKAGVYAWLVRLNDSNDAPDMVPALSAPGKVEEALFLLAPERCIGDPASAGSRGGVRPLAVGGSYRFRWLDGTDTGLLFHVDSDQGSFASRSVSWEPSTAAASCP